MGALDIGAVTSHYIALARLIPLKAITREADYRQAVAALEALGEVIESYEARAHRMPDVGPREALAYVMREQALKQTDLADIAGQGTNSAILSGQLGISKKLTAKLAQRFGVPVAVFL